MVMSGIIAVIPISAPFARRRFLPFTLRVDGAEGQEFHVVGQLCEVNHAPCRTSNGVVAERFETNGVLSGAGNAAHHDRHAGVQIHGWIGALRIPVSVSKEMRLNVDGRRQHQGLMRGAGEGSPVTG